MPAPPSSSIVESSRARAVFDQIVLWIAASLLTGILTVALARAINLGFSVFRWGWDNPDALWMAPVGSLLVFSPVALGLALVALATPAMGWRAATFVWPTLVAFSLLLLWPSINGYAWLMVAAGIGVQSMRFLGRRRQGTTRWAGRIALAGLALTTAAGLWVVPGGARRERAALAGLPEAPREAPNVLLLVLDTVRWKALGLYGNALATSPAIDAWSTQGVVFDEAYSTAPWTLPSHASMLTGRYAGRQSGTHLKPLDDAGVLTVTELLRDRGWATGGFTANLHATRRESGLAQGFLRYEDFQRTWSELVRQTTITQSDNVVRGMHAAARGAPLALVARRFWNADFAPHLTEESHDAKRATQVADDFLRWQESLPAGRPFFAFLNFFDAHSPYQPPEPYYAMFAKSPKVLDRYHGAVRFIDDEIGRMLEALERRGALRNTIVVLTADHGEQFGEHGLTGHANSLYAQLVHVPLVIVAPGRVPAGQRIPQTVSLRDLAATMLQLAGVTQPAEIGGTSLAATWGGAGAPTSDVVTEVDQSPRAEERRRNTDGPMKGVLNDSLYVIRDGRGGIEAYAYRLDPAHERNLATSPERTTAYRQLLEAAVSRNGLPWPKPFPPGTNRRQLIPDD